MKLRCPECSSTEVDSLTELGSRIECDNCAAEFAREEALVTVAESERDLRRVAPPQELFSLDRHRAAFDLRNLEGAVHRSAPTATPTSSMLSLMTRSSLVSSGVLAQTSASRSIRFP